MEQSLEKLNEASQTKEEVKEQVLTAYASSNEYLDDCLRVIMNFEENKYKNNEEFMADLRQMETKAENSKVKIPFEEKIKKYKFNLLEKFCLFFLGLIGFTRGYRGILDYANIVCKFTKNAHIKGSEVINMLNEKNKLRKTKCVIADPRHDDVFCLNKELSVLLTGIKETKAKKSMSKTDISIKNNKPKMIYEEVSRYVISQDEAKRSVSTAVCEHLTKCKINAESKNDKLDKTNTLIIGPTGTGKTYLCQKLADILKIPFYLADMSKMSESGYVGDAVDTVLVRLKKTLKRFNGIFPPSLIYLDEIDKICAQRDYLNRDTTGLSVQQELLKLIESNKYSPYEYHNTTSECDISNIMFIAGGAFSGLDKIIKKRLKMDIDENKTQIGFVSNNANSTMNENVLKKVISQDLVEYGFMPELIGRFSNIVVLDPLSEDDLIKILSDSKNNVIEQYKRIFKEYKVDLDVQESLFKQVAQKAIEKGTGARGLKNIFAKICSDYLFEIEGNKNGKITITEEDLKKIA